MLKAHGAEGDPDAVRAVWEPGVYTEGDRGGAGDFQVLCVKDREEGSGEAAGGDGVSWVGE